MEVRRAYGSHRDDQPAHVAPLDLPGTGDAGGMNVYVVELARQLARRDIGAEVDVFTRATTSALAGADALEAGDNVLVRHVARGAVRGASPRASCPAQLCTFAREPCCGRRPVHVPGRYDAIHSHYWLSGQAGAAGPRPLGRAAGAHHAHHGEGEERQRSRTDDAPEPRGPAARRGAGRRGRGSRCWRTPTIEAPAADRACTARSRRGSAWSTPAWTWRCSRPGAPRRLPGRRLGLPVDAARAGCSPGGCSR